MEFGCRKFQAIVILTANASVEISAIAAIASAVELDIGFLISGFIVCILILKNDRQLGYVAITMCLNHVRGAILSYSRSMLFFSAASAAAPFLTSSARDFLAASIALLRRGCITRTYSEPARYTARRTSWATIVSRVG